MKHSLARATLTAALAVALTLTAAGCGDSGDGDKSGSGGNDGASAGTRTVKTAMGPVKVPKNPKRVVVLDTNELDDALTLGVKPVGASRAAVDTGFLNYLSKDQVKGIADVGTIGVPNLEAISKLKPDLILSSKVRDQKQYGKLSKIAPTVFTETTGVTWKENFTLHAQALGKESEAESVTAAYDKHVKKVTGALGGAKKAAAERVSVVRFIEGAPTRLYGRGSYIGTILDDIGLSRSKSQDTKEMMVEISPERADMADGHAIFYGTYGSAEKSDEKKITGGALWKRLQAVKAGRSFAVDDQLWFQGIGYTAANKILDELQQDLTKRK